MQYPLTSCLIWGGHYEASGLPLYDKGVARIDDSPRAGGSYVFPWPSSLAINLSDEEKARLTTWLVDQRIHGVELPQVTEAIVEYVKARPPLPIHERANRLLRFIATQTRTVGMSYDTRKDDLAAYAWSESINREEIDYLIDHLLKAKSLDTLANVVRIGRGNHSIPAIVIVTVEGHRQIEQKESRVDSSQAFVAMWFDDIMSEAFENGIEPAILEAGYVPLRIDQKEHVNKIDDEIISELRRSRFLVADFTHGEDGARGGVYYEAGFAHGLGIPVIFTCREDAVDTLHFDINHYNHIVWSDPMDLREKLKNRILAVIGEGPEAHRSP